MAKTRGVARAERLRIMEELYLVRAYSDVEMAERLEVRRETAHADRKTLEAHFDFDEVEHGKYKIRRGTYFSDVKLNLYESLPLYLFARKSARQTGIAQTHVAKALVRIAATLKQPMAQKLAQSADRVLQQPRQAEQEKVFEVLAQAWVESHKVHLDYIALGSRRPVRHTLNPYLIEPSVWSDAIYVIGWSEPDRRIMPFKIGRIEFASMSSETFEMPADFDEAELLKHAWGVWQGDAPAQPVRLRFTDPVAIQRLKETRWHPLEQVTDEGSACIWEAPIAEWQEMLPWVRGWGAACEVLGPREFKETLMGEAKAMAGLYGWTVGTGTGDVKNPPTLADTFADFFGGER